MSLKKNIIANYFSQFYVTVIGILILPLYVKYMGAEAYGLVGFFALLQSWFALLDLGLTPTVARETARYRGGVTSALDFRRLMRMLSIIFFAVALLGGGGLWLFSNIFAEHWLKANTLSESEVVLAVQIMAISVALRWLGGLYRGVVAGSERLIWLSLFNVIVASLRFIAVFFSMKIFGYTPAVFFMHQLGVAVVEVAGLYVMSSLLVPRMNSGDPIGWSFKPVYKVLRFSLSIAFTSSVWVVVTQTDKFILSGMLPLSDYGYFSIAVLMASGIVLITAPISSSVMPRMARLHAEGKHQELIVLYKKSTQLVAVLAGGAAVTIAYCAQPLLIAWTGDLILSASAAPILRLYAIGNGLLAVGAFPYYLQYARGNLYYHMLGSAVMVLFLVPAIVFSVQHFGAVGAGYIWVLLNGFFLIFWIAYVHHQLQPGLHAKWLMNDCLMILAAPAIVLSPLLWFSIVEESRWLTLVNIFFVSSAALIAAMFASSSVRELILKRIRGIT